MKENKILGNKLFLYATEFFAGMSVMAVELGASRLLAPYFSSSQIVWTVIIGTIMIAMALGNVWGGRAADKNPNPSRLYIRILIAAVWIAAIPFVGKYVIAGISLGVAEVIDTNFLIWASLASCLVVFVFPLLLLGTATPSLAKYTVNNLEDSGKTVGTLGALNTIGSIIGTFIPTFVTIPSVGTAATFIIFALILAVLSVIYFVSAKINLVKSAVAIVLIILFSLSTIKYSFAFWDTDIVYEGESIYNYLQVKEDDEKIVFSTNAITTFQSVKMKDKQLTGMYYDYALAAPYMANVPSKDDSNILILGLGTGTYADMCLKYFDKMQVTGVEIDEKITDLAEEYFDMSKEVNVVVEDGRIYLSNSEKYNVIMVDAYQDITIPFQMSTVEFFTMVKEHLKENGVMVVNMNMYSSEEGSISDYLCDTIASVFKNVYEIDVPSGSNRELFVTQNDNILKDFTAQKNAIKDPALKNMMQKVLDNLSPVTGGDRILTDDKAPVELLGMKAIDEMIADQLSYYREIIRSGNWKELLEGF